MTTRILTSTILGITLVANAASAQTFGDYSIGVGAADVFSSEGSGFDQVRGSFSVSGSYGTQIGSFLVWGDGELTFTDNESPFQGTAPASNPGTSAVLAAHAGYQFGGSGYAGAFVGLGLASGWGSGFPEASLNEGVVYGVEGQYDFNQWQVFAQYGMAELDGGLDVLFEGPFYSAGLAYDFGSYAVIGEYYQGESPDDYEDRGDWGDYQGFSLTYERDLSDAMTLYATASSFEFVANTEDEAEVNRLEIGLRFLLGDRPAGDRLSGPIAPVMAAGWGASLD